MTNRERLLHLIGRPSPGAPLPPPDQGQSAPRPPWVRLALGAVLLALVVLVLSQVLVPLLKVALALAVVGALAWVAWRTGVVRMVLDARAARSTD